LKFILPRPKKDLVLRPGPPHLAPNACPYPCGKDLDKVILYTNDTVIVCGGLLEKRGIQPTSWKMLVGPSFTLLKWLATIHLDGLVVNVLVVRSSD
jgi:hypothetical protein